MPASKNKILLAVTVMVHASNSFIMKTKLTKNLMCCCISNILKIKGPLLITLLSLTFLVTSAQSIDPCTDPSGIDTDNDGINDICDLDDDNDGILDSDDCNNRVNGLVFDVDGSISPQTFNFTGTTNAELGFFFDFYYLDNSFNFNINGVDLVPSELQFQSSGSTYGAGTESLVVFESDNTRYGTPGNDAIYLFNRDGGWNGDEIPIVRLVINSTGGVKILGKRTEESAFEKLKIRDTDPQFNTLSWNFNGDNQVTITQKSIGATQLAGLGYGLTECTLDTDGDGLINSLDTDSDNDGCPDALEGAASLAANNTLSGGSNGGSSNNITQLDVDINGIPIAANAGQARASGVVTPVNYSSDTLINGTLAVGQGDSFIISSDAMSQSTDVNSSTPPYDPDYSAPSATDVTDDLVYTWTFDNGGGPVSITPTESGATGQTFDFGTVTTANEGIYEVTITHLINECIFEVRSIALEVDEVCSNPPTLNLSSETGSTCANSPITISENTFGGGATAISSITADGVGTLDVASAATSPFSFTYTPAVGDEGNVVAITVITNNPDPEGGLCTSSTAIYELTINALPTVSITAPANVCLEAGIQTSLDGGSPQGGVYSGLGVTDDGNGMTYSFDPEAVGPGIYTITYDYTDANGCSSSANNDIEVYNSTPDDTASGEACGLNTYNFEDTEYAVGIYDIERTDENGCSYTTVLTVSCEIVIVDSDNDGIADENDNCPDTANADQADADGDLIGDICDDTPNGDDDNDGVDNAVDVCQGSDDAIDTDQDGTPDGCDSTPNGDENEGGNNNNGKITICHYPPGNSGNVQTIEISVSAWPAHEAHGDSLGACNNEDDDNEDPEVCFASTVISFDQGLRSNGNEVPLDRSDANAALGEPDMSNAPGGFVSLGIGGQLTLQFSGAIYDTPEDDFMVYETSFAGDNCSGSNDEKATIEVSQDGINWFYAGEICRDGGIDIDGLPLIYVSQIRITDITTGSGDGFDVDGVVALSGCSDMPEVDNDPCYGSFVIGNSYMPGPKSNGQPITDPARLDVSKALGEPQVDNSSNFVSLGYGGEITIGFDGVVLNQAGDDLVVVETTNGTATFGSYPESADVYVSQDGFNFYFIGSVLTDESAHLDISNAPIILSYITQVKLVDTTPIGSVSDDGFDLDGIISLPGCTVLEDPNTCFTEIANGGFENGNTFSDPWSYVLQEDVPGWRTTASTGTIEIQKSGMVDGIESDGGGFHFELNGDALNNIYQEICTTPGTNIEVSFSHRKRGDSGVDMMELYFGDDVSSIETGTAYPFVATPGAGWETKTFVYEVPAGQASTVIFFKAVSGTSATVGNLLDDISVSATAASATTLEDLLALLGTEEQVFSKTKIVMYPVPARNQLNLKLTSQVGGTVAYDIISLVGQSLKRGEIEAKSGQTEISTDISNLADGAYFLLVYINGETISKKFIKATK